MPKCYIFAAGSFYGLHEIPEPADFVIAADAGYKYCLDCGIEPDLTVGDLDSLDITPSGILIRLPVEKDETDTLFAVKKGMELGYRDFVIYGGTGGRRPEHSIANMQALLFMAANGARGRMYDEHVLYRVIANETLRFPEGTEGNFSLFCLDGEARGVSLRGFKYSLNNALIRSDFPLGVSNSFTGSEAEVTVADGRLIIVTDIKGDTN